MIRLTGVDGLAIYINPDKVIGANESTYYEGTLINYGSDSYVVTESPEEVARKVLEYRLELERYKAAVRVGIEQDNLSGRQMAEGAMDILGELAGLEEPNHD